MVRINLLPREILEKRKWDRWYPYVFIAAAIAVLVVAAIWVILQFQMVQKNNELQTTNETIAQLNKQADSFAIFEQQQQQLEARQKVIEGALAGRVDMARVAEEISLILPDEVWISRIAAGEQTGLTMDMFTLASKEDKFDRSFKSVAKTLVRLASLEQLRDVWLTSATNVNYKDFYVPPVSPGATPMASVDTSVPAVSFQTTAKIVIPAAPAAATNSVPAPPSTPGQ
jgi:Tfp pilus assembly protein PilN